MTGRLGFVKCFFLPRGIIVAVSSEPAPPHPAALCAIGYPLPLLCSANIRIARFSQTSRRRFKRSTALLQPNIRDANRQGPTSQGRAHPLPIDRGSLPSGRLHVSAEDPAPQAPTHCADAHDCNESSTLAESSGDVPQTSGSSN